MKSARRSLHVALGTAAIGLVSMVLDPLHAQNAGPAALPLIEVRPSPAGIEIAGRVMGLAVAEITAEMSIERTGQSGNVSTTQSAAWPIAVGQTREIAKVGISFAAGDRLTVAVVLRRDAQVIAQTTLEVPGR